MRHRQGGFTYLAALFLIAVAGAAAASVTLLWSTASQRSKERELLFAGDQFRRAIGEYYERSPGTLKKYPPGLNDLLKDERQLGIRRYLRKIWRDPLTQTTDWGLIQSPEGGIMGVYSLSEARPLKQGGFSENNAEFAGKQHYSGWKFVYRPQVIAHRKELP